MDCKDVLKNKLSGCYNVKMENVMFCTLYIDLVYKKLKQTISNI